MHILTSASVAKINGSVYKCTLLPRTRMRKRGKVIVLLPHAHMRKRGKAIVLYVCQHKNHHFGKSRDLGNSLASLFRQSAQKTAFNPLQIVWQSSRMS